MTRKFGTLKDVAFINLTPVRMQGPVFPDIQEPAGYILPKEGKTDNHDSHTQPMVWGQMRPCLKRLYGLG